MNLIDPDLSIEGSVKRHEIKMDKCLVECHFAAPDVSNDLSAVVKLEDARRLIKESLAQGQMLMLAEMMRLIVSNQVKTNDEFHEAVAEQRKRIRAAMGMPVAEVPDLS